MRRYPFKEIAAMGFRGEGFEREYVLPVKYRTAGKAHYDACNAPCSFDIAFNPEPVVRLPDPEPGLLHPDRVRALTAHMRPAYLEPKENLQEELLTKASIVNLSGAARRRAEEAFEDEYVRKFFPNWLGMTPSGRIRRPPPLKKKKAKKKTHELKPCLTERPHQASFSMLPEVMQVFQAACGRSRHVVLKEENPFYKALESLGMIPNGH